MLTPFYFEIHYKKGTDNSVSDFLTREYFMWLTLCLLIIGVMQSSGNSSSNKGRGRGKAPIGRNIILAQIGNQKLITSNIAGAYTSTSGINTGYPMYKEFMNHLQYKKAQGNNPPSYSSILTDEGNENIEIYDKNEKDEVILLLEPIY